MFVRLNKGHGTVVFNTKHITMIEEITGGSGGYHIHIKGGYVADLTKEEGDALIRSMASDIATVGDPEE